jgi:hypothetical protein
MKNLLVIAFLVAVLFVISNEAMAAQFGQKQQWELGGSISYTSTSFSVGEGSLGTFAIAPYAGYFIMDQFELGLQPVIVSLSPSEGDAITNVAVFLSPAWNFKLEGSQVTPFIEGQIGFNSISSGGESLSGLAYGGRGGIKVLVGDNALVNIGIQYQSLDMTPDGAPESIRQNTFGVAAGFTIFVP